MSMVRKVYSKICLRVSYKVTGVERAPWGRPGTALAQFTLLAYLHDRSPMSISELGPKATPNQYLGRLLQLEDNITNMQPLAVRVSDIQGDPDHFVCRGRYALGGASTGPTVIDLKEWPRDAHIPAETEDTEVRGPAASEGAAGTAADDSEARASVIREADAAWSSISGWTGTLDRQAFVNPERELCVTWTENGLWASDTGCAI